MRINEEAVSAIREEVARLDPTARVYLFGSRLNDAARGGDIDLLIQSERIGFAEKLLLKVRILERIGWQQLDLVVVPASRAPTAWAEAITREGREL